MFRFAVQDALGRLTKLAFVVGEPAGVQVPCPERGRQRDGGYSDRESTMSNWIRG